MRVFVDPERCQAHGDCTLAAPEVFDIDFDANVSVPLIPEPPEELRERIEEAVDLCPTRAIRLEG
jgi:ferredoxin